MNEIIGIEQDQVAFTKKLREETAESHQKLEENELSKKLLASGVTLADYQAYLIRLYGVNAACEQHIFPVIGHLFPDLDKRSKTDLLVNDLRHTGLSDQQIAEIPVPELRSDSTGSALGTTYVIEGSTLGGRMIFKHIHSKFGFDEKAGASYFAGYGQETGPMWKSFMATLSQYAVESGESADIIQSAKQTFSLIDRWL
jgi:heme oxygenase (biliverdin-IX-beta and delta-forming)